MGTSNLLFLFKTFALRWPEHGRLEHLRLSPRRTAGNALACLCIIFLFSVLHRQARPKQDAYCARRKFGLASPCPPLVLLLQSTN